MLGLLTIKTWYVSPIAITFSLTCRGEPIWPKSGMPGLHHGMCQACGSQLSFQLQLMCPLIAAIEEAFEWTCGTDMMHRTVPDWEWLTVAFYACSAETCRDKQLIEMIAVIVNEEIDVK